MYVRMYVIMYSFTRSGFRGAALARFGVAHARKRISKVATKDKSAGEGG